MGLISWMVGKLITHPVYVKDPYKAKYLQEQRNQEWINKHPYEYEEYLKQLKQNQYHADRQAAKAAEEEYAVFLADKIQHDQEIFNLNKQALIHLDEKVSDIKLYLNKFNLEEFNNNLNNMSTIQKEINIALNSKSLISIVENNDDRWTEMINSAEKDIRKAEAKLVKQKADLNSGKNVGANDPQKAEKLAKIAELQRELDSLKSEVSEESNISSKNN